MDFHLLPLVRREGQDQTDLPGLHIAAPPRRPARGRSSDRLVFYLSMEGNSPLPQDQQDQLLKRLSESYYKTPGSVTAAMRTLVESLNQYLLDRNLRNASSGRQGLALLSLATFRENRLYLAQCGPVHAYLLTVNGVRHIFDPQPARRGLGLGRTAPIYYAQAELDVNDVLLVCHQPPAAWNETTLGELTGHAATPGQAGAGLGLESLRRRLLPLAGDELASLLVQAKPGTGKTFLLKPKPMPAAAEPSPTAEDQSTPISLPVEANGPPPGEREAAITPEPAAEEIHPIGQTIAETVAPGADALEEPVPTQELEPLAPVRISEAPSPGIATPPMSRQTPTPAARLPEIGLMTPGPGTPQAVAGQPQPMPSTSPPAPAPAGRRRRARSSTGAGVSPVIATIGRAFGGVFGQFSQALGTLFQRMLPGEGSLPGPVMALVAIVVPLVVVTVALVIYNQRGVGGKYESLYAQAVQAAGSARAQADPMAQERDWNTVMEKLGEADSYEVRPESQALRQQAQQAIDTLNLAIRLDFQPAISGGLPRDARITRIAASDTDLYLLDASGGNALRAFLAGNGYELDNTYQCGPGFEGSQGIGPLVDVLLYSKPDGSGTVLLGLDGLGNVLECSPGAPPLFTQLSPPPSGWTGTQAFDASLGTVYVLDPTSKQIWVYPNGSFNQQPDLFFDQDIPPLEDVIDLAVEQEDLYLLHKDGRLTHCSFSAFGVAITQCTDPAPYLDARPGREGQPMSPFPVFSKLLSTQPPDPSLYLLEPTAPAVYHFSLRLAYQRRLEPQSSIVISRGEGDSPLSARPASAFALSPDSRVAFLAFDNEVVYAGMP